MPSLPMLSLSLTDNEFPASEITHDRHAARGIAFDDDGCFYFVRADREDLFGSVTTIETAGGGVEKDETPEEAVLRELKEELGADTRLVCKIGVVSDYYNVLHRHNINHYFLCRVRSFGERELLPYEANAFHLTTLRLSFEEAEAEYERCAASALGRLIRQREMPVLRRAAELLKEG